MTPLTAPQVKERLCKAVERAAEARFEPDEKAVIPADLIRRLALRRPLGREQTVRPLTPFGIRIVGATIRKRLDLDNATPLEGGPLCPLEFHDCHFEGGFSGAHARFSRLSFKACRFHDAAPGADGPVPSVNLAGASLGSDLGLREIKPASDKDHLWIRATGAGIDGEIDLSRSVLKAPAQFDRLLSDASCDALDLSLAEVRGDLQFLNGGRCTGRINMRGLHITGDIWMSGAHLKAATGRCLFLQSAMIGGNLILDGRAPTHGKSGQMEWFEAVGEINLHEMKLSGSLSIKDMVLQPGEADPRTGEGGICVYLVGARIGGSLSIGSSDVEKSGSKGAEKSRISGRILLDRLEVASSLTLENAQIGLRTDPETPATISARSLVAKRVEVKGIEPLLWSDNEREEINPKPQILSVNLDGARVERLKIHGSRFSGYLRARPLTCAGDVTLDVWVGEDVNLKGSDIGGSLIISDLRADKGLDLRDAGIGRALKFKRPPGPDGRLEDLVKARVTKLKCLPDTSLIETLWRYQSGSDKVLVCQIAFLRKRGLIRALDKPEALDSFAWTQGHAIDDVEAAEEYVRVMAAYGGAPETRAWITPRLDRLSEFVRIDPAAPASTETLEPAAAGDAAATPAPPVADEGTPPAAGAPDGPCADPLPSLDALPADLFDVLRFRDGGTYRIVACFLRGDHLVRASFAVTPVDGRIMVEPSFEEPVGPQLIDVPVARDLYTYHPANAENQAAFWVIRPVLVNDDEGNEDRLQALQTLLLPYVQPGSSIRGEVNLTDLSCDTLDDGGGQFWGKALKFHLDRFVYRQATWVDDPPHGRFGDWVGRHFNRLLAERVPSGLIDRLGWRQTRLQAGDFWAPWQVRRNWIYQQFKLDHDLTSPTRHRIDQSEYRPQPFEQAIRVARSEGREDFAANFEILKRRIEWSLFSRRSRRLLLMLGIAAALAWLLLTGGLHVETFGAMASLILLVIIATRMRSDKYPFIAWLLRTVTAMALIAGTIVLLAWPEGEPWTRARNFAVAVLILVALRFVSAASDWLMRNLFGYLRLPINAIVSLIGAFLIGWAGVEIANDRGMLIIDVEPVANLVARDTDRRVYVGAQRGGTGVRNVHCDGEINEPLYALDVLIPLIDLRQESRCEVGRAIPFDATDRAGARKSVGRLVEQLFGSILNSESFWAAAKALYAIAGWFLVSLSILTFANSNRPRGEPPAS